MDEDYKRVYPYNNLGSKVLGFTGGDNKGNHWTGGFYDQYLKRKVGRIRTLTDGSGIEIDGAYEGEGRTSCWRDLYISLDVNLQNYAVQACKEGEKEREEGKTGIHDLDESTEWRNLCNGQCSRI